MTNDVNSIGPSGNKQDAPGKMLVHEDERGVAKWRVLIWPGSTEIGMELREALAPCKEVELFSAGSGEALHAEFTFRRHFVLPSVSKADWLPRLQAVVRENSITHIFPAHDETLLALASHAEEIPAKVLASPLSTCVIARSKSETYRVLHDVVPVPQLYSHVEDVPQYPVFLKPDRGQGSSGIARADDAGRVVALLKEDPSLIICEYLPGEEFSVDCFSDRERGLLYVQARTRGRIRSGISMESRPVELPEARWFAERISLKLPFHGAWFFQLKRAKSGELKLQEVASRIAGTSAVTRMIGVNLPLLSLFECERLPTAVAPTGVQVSLSRALQNRYLANIPYRTLYVDLDDTLIVRGELNLELLSAIYQALARKAHVVLITRHRADPRETLKKWRISEVFDEVIHLRGDENKADYITETPAVLVDDSFRERQSVSGRAGVVAISPDMVGVLVDDRV